MDQNYFERMGVTEEEANERTYIWIVRFRFDAITFKTVVAADTESQAANLALQNLISMFTTDERAKLGPTPLAEVVRLGKCLSCFA